jgi:CRISPR-associated endonuclease/helicase Cas3
MAELPVLGADDFAPYFEAIHGNRPFPWQARLAARLAGGGSWPEVLDLPTGSGKTAAIDVAVFQLAVEAGRATRSAPLRVIYVVDRRTIVDQAHERAQKIVQAIEQAQHGVLGVVRARLASYGRDAVPLRTALLRGGIARSDTWARSPDQPLVAVSTVDQVGSRLLFRGYGVSDAMKPIHAGLLGNDVLYLLDEVHLSEPFRQTLEAIGGRYGGWADSRLPSPFAVVEMSATPGRLCTGTFRLEADDESHPVLSRRLQASKLTTLAAAAGRAFLGDVEKHVKPLVARPGATVAVVVNRVAAARELHERLSGAIKAADVHLLTGRMRPLDRDALEKDLFHRICAGRKRDPAQRPVVIVATQCIEAGADFDFDGLVTECASLDALRQRFGRLDRLGELAGEARGVVIARTDTLDGEPVYGVALGATWQWLSELSSTSRADGKPGAEQTDQGAIDFGINGLTVPEDAVERGLLAPKSHAPILLPSHLDAWIQTSPMPIPDPDVALWLHGPERGVADVQVVWRADLTAELLQEARDKEDPNAPQAQEVALGAVEALPPASGEAMAVPFVAVKRWLDGRSEPDTFDVEGAHEAAPEDEKKEKERERAARPALAWRGEASEVIDAAGVRPGDTIVVPASYGGIASGTWAPAAEAAIVDIAEIAVLRQRGRGMLRLHPNVVAGLFGAAAPPPPTPQPLDSEDVDDRAAVVGWLAAVQLGQVSGDVATLVRLLAEESGKRGFRIERLPLAADAEHGEYFLVSARRRLTFDGGEVTTEDDRASFTGVRMPLAEHLGGVGNMAGEFAERVGLPAEVAADVRLAGRWHDVGKADPRFQRLLQGGSEFKALVQTEPLAKSALPMNDRRARQQAQLRSGYPRGTRHEVMSVALMASADAELASLANDWELVLHLVASHHGRCRPLAPWVPDPTPVEVKWEFDGVAIAASSSHELARLDSGVGERFWRLVRRYGWWGLAWLEAILRLGDHRRSEEEQRSPTGGAA